MTTTQRLLVLFAVFMALLFDGVELGLMPVASLSVSKGLLGDDYTARLGGDWFARFTAALMLGAAIGGIFLGQLGDRIGRTRAMGVCILIYSVFAFAGAYVQTQTQMLCLRFFVGLGVGGLWPNGMSLVAECWQGMARPKVAGLMAAGLNLGILCLSQLARWREITPDDWRWLFQLAGAPALLGVFTLLLVPESPTWHSRQTTSSRSALPLRQLFRPGLWKTTLLAIGLSAVPLIGAWSASKWMIPWADKVAGTTFATYKAETQGWWALGAVIGSYFGALFATWLGRRVSYALISVATFVTTLIMFQGTEPLAPSFHSIVFAQGLLATLFFGWLAVYLPEVFPVEVRATGSGLAYNAGRFATAIGVLFAGFLFNAMDGSYPRVGTTCALVYAVGIALAFAIQPKSVDALELEQVALEGKPAQIEK